jgi:hypothetical protein
MFIQGMKLLICQNRRPIVLAPRRSILTDEISTTCISTEISENSKKHLERRQIIEFLNFTYQRRILLLTKVHLKLRASIVYISEVF